MDGLKACREAFEQAMKGIGFSDIRLRQDTLWGGYQDKNVAQFYYIWQAALQSPHPHETAENARLRDEETYEWMKTPDNANEPYTRTKMDWWWLEQKLQQKRAYIRDLERRLQETKQALQHASGEQKDGE